MIDDVNVPDPLSPDPLVPEDNNGEPTPPVPGSKTPPELLLKSLQEEREENTRLKEELELLKGSPASPDIFSEEGKILQKQIQESNEQISKLTQENARKDLFIAHPILKEKNEEFEKFLADPENKGMPLKTAAKAFLVENGLLDPVRLGLEKPTGGPRTPPSTGMTNEEIKTLRETNFKKYQDMLEKGLIKV